MLAKSLSDMLGGEYTLRFLTRHVRSENEYLWDVADQYIDSAALQGVDVIVHLAGAAIAEKRWTRARKELIRSSRVDGAQLILKTLKKYGLRVDLFLSASAIGYYGSVTSEVVFDEECGRGDDFLSNVCSQWEAVVKAFESRGVARRVAILRLGVVLASDGGVLPKMSQPIRCGLGAVLGSGRQYMPWIHIVDLCRAFCFVIDQSQLSGVFNAVAPEHIRHADLTKRIGKILGRSIVLPPMPSFLVRLLFGEKAVILLEGSRVSSAKIIDSGFHFLYGNIDHTLDDLLLSSQD